MSNKATLKNIAEMLQISISTVSRALNIIRILLKRPKRR